MTDNQRKRGPWLGCLSIGMLLALPVYVLSIGPYFWLFRHGYIPTWTGVFYAPIAALTRPNSPLRPLLEWYLRLWGVL
jgi:hypothetical protein